MKTYPVLRAPDAGQPAGSGTDTSSVTVAPSPSNPFAPSTPSVDSRPPDGGSRGPATPASPGTSAPPQTPGAGVPPSAPVSTSRPLPGAVAPEAGSDSPTVPATPQQIVMTPEMLRQIVQPQGTPAGQPAQPQMSDAEFNRTFNIYTADENTYEALLGVKPDSPARVQALNTVLQSVAKQAVTIAKFQMDQLEKRISGQFQPIAQTVQSQKEAAYQQEFFTSHQDLKEYEPLVREVVTAAQNRVARGELSFKTPQEAMTYVAQTVRKLLNKPAPTAAAGGSASTTTPAQPGQAPGARPMTPTAMGGRSGAPGGATPAVSTAQRIFGT